MLKTMRDTKAKCRKCGQPFKTGVYRSSFTGTIEPIHIWCNSCVDHLESRLKLALGIK